MKKSVQHCKKMSVQHCKTSHCKISYCKNSCCTISYCTISYCEISCRKISYCKIWYCKISFCKTSYCKRHHQAILEICSWAFQKGRVSWYKGAPLKPLSTILLWFSRADNYWAHMMPREVSCSDLIVVEFFLMGILLMGIFFSDGNFSRWEIFLMGQ